MLFAAEDLPVQTAAEAANSNAYRVLARKYRPQNFDQLIGQEALVRTLTNAINMGRLAHAWMLTGIRGIGKTTTARIIAKALNCENGPTATPCDTCSACISIRDGRNVDVMEIDAASNTGVDNIREIIDSARYAPTSARYKVYIIDEVHMLSKSAFNALLKTLEEPPAHVKFVLATTEVRKVPITVLSRCQRFDLRRVESTELVQHFQKVLANENGAAEDEALRLIAQAADGSVRDGLSLLDQALAEASLGEGRAEIKTDVVQNMLGLADRSAVHTLAAAIFGGDSNAALAQLHELYRAGADPHLVLQDLLGLLHTLARLITSPNAELDLSITQRAMAAELAAKLQMPEVQRAWQMLLKGMSEVSHAPQPQAAAEMVILRLVYAADLPPPGELLKATSQTENTNTVTRSSAPPPSGGGTQMRMVSGGETQNFAPAAQIQTQSQPVQAGPMNMPKTFADAVALFEINREAILHSQLYSQVHVVSYAPGRIELRLAPNLPRDFTGKIAQKLQQWTGAAWLIGIANAGGEATLAEQAAERQDARLRTVQADPMVRAVMEHFPGARIVKVTEPELNTDTGEHE
jgi:DNA polymerase-3 subunit gamma/tau